MTHYYKMELIPKFVFEDRGGQIPPIVTVKSNDPSPTYVGRNALTQIKNSNVSRQLCSVEVSNTGAMSVLMRKPQESHQVSLDGVRITAPMGVKTPLYAGSTLSLFNHSYSYHIKLSDDVETIMRSSNASNINTSAAARVTESENEDFDSDSLPKSMDKVSRNLKSSMIDEMVCSICLGIIWQTTAVNPCGHLYCKACIEDCKRCGDGKCPKCRIDIKGTLALPPKDRIIFCMIRAGEFESDDTEHFLRRSGKCLSKEEVKLMKRQQKNNQQSIIPSIAEKKNNRPRKRKLSSTDDVIHVDEPVASINQEENPIAIPVDISGNNQDEVISID